MNEKTAMQISSPFHQSFQKALQEGRIWDIGQETAVTGKEQIKNKQPGGGGVFMGLMSLSD